MTEFVKQELVRLIDKLPETDPRSPDYQMLLRSIECLDAMGQTIDEIVELAKEGLNVDTPVLTPAQVVELSSAIKAKAETGDHVVVAHVPPFTAAEFPEEPPDEVADEFVKGTTVAENATTAPTTETKTYTSSEVRAALVDARGKGADIKAVMTQFGVNNFQEIPAARYAELMAVLEAV